MTPAPRRGSWSALRLTLVIGGCAAETDGAASDGAAPAVEPDAGSDDPSYELTFSALYEEVIRTSNCTLGLCHGEGARGGALDLAPQEDAYDNLVGAPSQGAECAALGYARVEPGAPERSLLWLKLAAEPPCGAQVPPGGGLSPAQRAQIRRWIELGALND